MSRRARLLERVAWGVGLSLIALYFGAMIHRSMMSRADLADFERASAGIALASAQADPSPAPQPSPSPVLPESLGIDAESSHDHDTSLWDQKRIRLYEESLEVQMGLPLGILRIPNLALEVPIRLGTDELILNRAVGHIEGTALPDEPGNLGIAGHRDGFFRGLKDIEPGDTLEIQTLSMTRIYRISEIVIVQPEDVWVLDATPEHTVTLVTCYPFYFVGSAPQRYIVKATLVSSS